MVYPGDMAKKSSEPVMCMACDQKPALPGGGPTKLCAVCKALATKGSRGVEMKGKRTASV